MLLMELMNSKSPSSAQTLMLCKYCSATSKSGDDIIRSALVKNLKHSTIKDAMKKAHSIPFRLRIAGNLHILSQTRGFDSCSTQGIRNWIHGCTQKACSQGLQVQVEIIDEKHSSGVGFGTDNAMTSLSASEMVVSEHP